MLSQDYVTKIEGHGKIKVDFKNNKASLIVDEGERYFEALVLNRPYFDIPFIVSRICGVCPTSHYLASLKALENALGVTPSETSVDLRKIILLGQITQSHILHTVFLALPDYIDVDSVSDIAKKAPAEFASAIKIKKVTDKVVEVIGGRPVHPVTPTVGGFTKYPEKKNLINLRDDLENNIHNVISLVNLFANLTYPNFVRETHYLAMESDREYALYDGNIMSSNGVGFKVENYKNEIKESVVANSSAKLARFKDKEFMVGALARVSNHPHKLAPMAQKMFDEYFENKNFPSSNPFHNNFAQMIEILHGFEEMIKLLNKVIKEGLGESKVKYKIKAGTGYGAVEAPRGALYHSYEIDKNGIITNCDIITPTVQNLANLEEDTKKLMETTKSFSNKKRGELLEKLIRAYDPCITCSVH